MRSITPTPRGMALIMAMIVVVLITMLVAGAISFTGTEVTASQVQSQEAAMSACIQAARNLFISRLQLKPDLVPCDTPLDGSPPPTPPPGQPVEQCLYIDFNDTFLSVEDPHHGHQLTTGHLGSLHRLSGRLSGAMNDPLKRQRDDSDLGGPGSHGPEFYIVTAVCRDNTVAGAPEREIEFMVRTDL
jgi:hypothetical protein